VATPLARSGEPVALASNAPARTTAVLKAESLEVVQLVLPAGGHLPTHSAPGEITLFGLAGTLTIDLPGRRVQLGAGDFLHLARGVPHAVHAADAARALLTICLHRERPGATNRQDGA
jgi:quercetin dioxygenase-like cupin family protein